MRGGYIHKNNSSNTMIIVMLAITIELNEVISTKIAKERLHVQNLPRHTFAQCNTTTATAEEETRFNNSTNNSIELTAKQKRFKVIYIQHTI
jgi:hypothetical protein